MAIGTGNFVLRDRVMRELGEFHLDFLMTAFAQLLLIVAANLLLRSQMQFMTGKAAHLV